MDSLSFIASQGLVLASLSLAFQGFGLLRELVQHSTTETQKRFNRTYSPVHALALWIFLSPAVEQLERMEDQILHQSDDDILAFKNSYCFDCSMIAVAVRVSLYNRLDSGCPRPCQTLVDQLGTWSCFRFNQVNLSVGNFLGCYHGSDRCHSC